MDGIIVVNKEKGYTSRDVVNIISKTFNTRKVGHTGTLDPLATGVLVVCIGKALKTVELLTNDDKEYIARVIIGYETDTLDISGRILKEKKTTITKNDVISVLEKLTGVINQEVPKYSAVKINGKKLYEYARNNIEVTAPIRKVEIFELKLISDIDKIGSNYEFTIKCKVSKGTYIRSLIRDIGYELNSYGTMKELTRIRQGNFKITDSFTIDDIKKDQFKIIKISDCLNYFKVVITDDKLLKKIKNGSVIDKKWDHDKVLFFDKDNHILALYRVCDNDKNKLQVWKMF